MANKIAYHSVVIANNGNGTPATITVYGAGTLIPSTIYSSPAGAAQVNPFATDANGRFVFYADPGEYDIEASGVGLVTQKLEDVSIPPVPIDEITLTPKAASTGAEGTIFYCSTDDHVYVATE